MIYIVKQINATRRKIGNTAIGTGGGRSLLLRRAYDAPIGVQLVALQTSGDDR